MKQFRITEKEISRSRRLSAFLSSKRRSEIKFHSDAERRNAVKNKLLRTTAVRVNERKRVKHLLRSAVLPLNWVGREVRLRHTRVGSWEAYGPELPAEKWRHVRGAGVCVVQRPWNRMQFRSSAWILNENAARLVHPLFSQTNPAFTPKTLFATQQSDTFASVWQINISRGVSEANYWKF